MSAEPAPEHLSNTAQPSPGRRSVEPSEPSSLNLPSGTVTFLLTDVEGSTALWERDERATQAALARHDALVAEVVAAQGGWLLKARGEGDSTFSVFADPLATVTAALALQQALLREHWPTGGLLRVRMGLHTGTIAPRDGDYYGPAVNRAARVRGLGHGGQILLSAATVAFLGETLPDGLSLQALGPHSLKGSDQPEAIFQLLHPTLPAEFPPLASPRAPKHNIPAPLTSFVGRKRELEEVRVLLERARLVTLTGTGGAGKTRLALEVGREVGDRYPDGVWLVELAPLADPALVPWALARVLGVHEEPDQPLLVLLASFLKAKRLLLVLDNCEHLVVACADVIARLLAVCPELYIMTSSREVLGVPGELVYRVPSLTVPGAEQLPALDAVIGFDAVRLFMARAQARRPDFALTEQHARTVCAICSRLDGIPLAIELAAARLDVLSVEAIASRLADRFRLLTGGPRTVLPRQQTLRAALDWSWDLLTEQEQIMLRRLSVFAGGCTLEAAEAVCAGDDVAEYAVLDLLTLLASKSLIVVEEQGGLPRHRLLETVREYAWERLQAAGEQHTLRGRHFAWYLAFGNTAVPHLEGPAGSTWLTQLQNEHDNLRAALDWSLQTGDSAAACIQLLCDLSHYWRASLHLSEACTWLARALSLDISVPAVLRARALLSLGLMASDLGDNHQAQTATEGALSIGRQLDDTPIIAHALNTLGLLARRRGDLANARALFVDALALMRAFGDKPGIARVLNNLGVLAQEEGNYSEAQALHQESLVVERASGNIRGMAASLNNLAIVASSQQGLMQALALFEQSLEWYRRIGDTTGAAMVLNNLGELAFYQDQYDLAMRLLVESLALRRQLGVQRGIAATLVNVAQVAVAQRDIARARGVYQELIALYQELGDERRSRQAGERLAELAQRE